MNANTIPAGFVLVPREITPAMIGAWLKAYTFEEGYHAMIAAAPSATSLAEAAEAGQVEAEPLTWYDGEPPFPQNQEWFIAETIYGDRVVLMALPDEYSYDYKTADQTYMKAENIKRWMQFPDCEYLPPEAPASPQAPAPQQGEPK